MLSNIFSRINETSTKKTKRTHRMVEGDIVNKELASEYSFIIFINKYLKNLSHIRELCVLVWYDS